MTVAMGLAATAVPADGRYLDKRHGCGHEMDSRAWVADWEYIVARDLARHLVPAVDTKPAYRPAGTAGVPEGAHAALSSSVGWVDDGGLLVVPAAVWPWRGWRRRSLYTPLGVAGIGQQGVGLWVRALPAPGVRVGVSFSEIAAVEDQAGGPCRVIAVTGSPGCLRVRFHDGWVGADGWIRMLRRRAAPVPAPIPPRHRGGHRPRDWPGLDSVLLSAGEGIACACWRSRARSAACLLALTSRELIAVMTRAGHGSPRRMTRRTLYVPRQSFQGAECQAETVRVRSAGVEVAVRLWSKKAAADASAWLGQVALTRAHR